MLKDIPKYIQMNMVGYAQTSRGILKDVNILVFPVLLITLTHMLLITGPKSG